MLNSTLILSSTFEWIGSRFDSRGYFITVKPMIGVWRIPVRDLRIVLANVPVHSYAQRVSNNLGNARSSYVLSLNDKGFHKIA